MGQERPEKMKHVAMVLIGEVLPRFLLLSAISKRFRRGCFYVVISGSLVAAFLLIHIYVLYEYLRWLGLDDLVAFLVADVAIIVCAILAKIYAYKQFDTAKSVAGGKPSIVDMVEAFLDGVNARCRHCGKRPCECGKS